MGIDKICSKLCQSNGRLYGRVWRICNSHKIIETPTLHKILHAAVTKEVISLEKWQLLELSLTSETAKAV